MLGDLQLQSSGWKQSQGTGFALTLFHWIFCCSFGGVAESCFVAAGHVKKLHFKMQAGKSWAKYDLTGSL